MDTTRQSMPRHTPRQQRLLSWCDNDDDGPELGELEFVCSLGTGPVSPVCRSSNGRVALALNSLRCVTRPDDTVKGVSRPYGRPVSASRSDSLEPASPRIGPGSRITLATGICSSPPG
jgi:hypothetical protein